MAHAPGTSTWRTASIVGGRGEESRDHWIALSQPLEVSSAGNQIHPTRGSAPLLSAVEEFQLFREVKASDLDHCHRTHAPVGVVLCRSTVGMLFANGNMGGTAFGRGAGGGFSDEARAEEAPLPAPDSNPLSDWMHVTRTFGRRNKARSMVNELLVNLQQL